MNRQDLQRLSGARVRDAKALLAAGNHAGAYYLVGYSVECAIKAAIAKQTQRHDFPNKRIALDSWTHDFKQLMQTAGLWPSFEAAKRANPDLGLNWAVANDWSEESRYSLTVSQQQATDLLSNS